MGTTAESTIQEWLLAAGKDPKTTGGVRDRISIAGNFLLKTGRLDPEKVKDALKGIDFSKQVTPLNRLPDRLYVQYVSKHRGHWFTTTGMTPEACGIVAAFRIRKLFRPAGSVCALQSTAAGIRDYWSYDKLFKWLDLHDKWDLFVEQAKRRGLKITDAHAEAMKKRLGSLVRGGGTQYYVPNPSQMSLLR